MYVCLCFGVTEKQVHAQIAAGASSPRQIASACKAGTDCGGCVKRIQAMLGRPSACHRPIPSAVQPGQQAQRPTEPAEQPHLAECAEPPGHPAFADAEPDRLEAA